MPTDDDVPSAPSAAAADLRASAGSAESADGPRLRTRVPLRWGDMDAYGHINNVEVLRILEEGRVRAFGTPAHTGRPVGRPQVPVFNDLPADVQTLVIEHRVRYLGVLQYRDVPVTVDVWVAQLKGAGMTLGYEVRDGHDESRCVIAETQLAFVHGPTGRLMRLSPEQREALTSHRADSPFAR